MVPGTGLEPVRCFHREILSLLSLPISPSWYVCSRLTPAVKNRAQPFRSMHHGEPQCTCPLSSWGWALSPHYITAVCPRYHPHGARVCGRGISPLAYRRTPQRELHPSYRTTREMFNCLLTTTRFYAFAPRLSSFRSLSGISMLGFYIAFSNRPFRLVTRGFSVSRLVTTLSLLPTPTILN